MLAVKISLLNLNHKVFIPYTKAKLRKHLQQSVSTISPKLLHTLNKENMELILILPHIRLVPAQCGATNVVSTNMPLIGYLEQIFLILREKLGEMMTLFQCSFLWSSLTMF